MLKNTLRFFMAVWLCGVSGHAALALDTRTSSLNQGTVGMIASHAELLDDAVNIANAVDHTDGLRVLPILGRGGLQSINDLLFLRGVDVAMLSADSLAFAKKNNLYADETGKISYLAKIGAENIVIVAQPEFTTLASLKGKRVAVGTADSDEFVAAQLILDSADLSFNRVALRGDAAIAALVDKRVDAAIFHIGADTVNLAGIRADSGLHIIPVPLNEKLGETYSPAIVTDKELPGLVPAGSVIETVSSALVLAVFDWPKRSERFYKLEKFNKALFKNYFANVKAENATNVLASVPGWKRYPTTTASQ